MADGMKLSNIESAVSRRPKNRRSPVWDYFKVAKDDLDIVQCLLCGCRLRHVSSSTSSMLGHIQKKHSELVVVPNLGHLILGSERQAIPEANSSVSEDNALTQAQDESLYGDGSSRSGTNKLFEMCVNDLRPIRIVDGDGFREFVHELNPDYVIPSSVTLSAMIQATYWKTRDQIKQRLQSVDHLGLNIEQWIRASSNGHVCITVTAFFINSGWNVEPAVLMTRELPERFGADDLTDVIGTCLEQYEIPEGKVTGINHDNTQHMITVCSKLNWKNICCVGSALNSTIKKALELPAVKQILIACRKVVDAFSKSRKLQDLIEKDSSLTLTRLVHDDSTDLNCIFDLIECVADHKDHINTELIELQLVSGEEEFLSFKPEMWNTIFELKLVCDLLKRTSNVLMGNEYVSASLVLPVINGLLTKPLLAQQPECSDSVIESFKMAIKEELSRHFIFVEDDVVDDSLHFLASALDPRFKSLRFAYSKQKQSIKNIIVRRLCEMQEKDSPTDDDDSEERLSKKAKLSDNISFLVGDVDENVEVVGDLTAVGELEAFLAMPTLNNGDNPLEWWRIYQKQFPRLSKLARRYLCMPASNFPIGISALESDDSDFVTKRRMLENETTDPLIFLNRNFRSQFHMDLLSSNTCNEPHKITG